ncbi:MAG: hypothetical protein KBD66_00485 [Candidatus Doudnabacteria bacterium]|nr:hypothetical protein [Candidatus Doudnabacteria bacterium]
MNLKLKQKAISLRKLGKTYAEIQTTLGSIPKGTLSTWLKSVELSTIQKKRILERMKIGAAKGRQKGGWRNRELSLERIENIKQSAIMNFGLLSHDPLFIMGVTLYWAEGSKTNRSFQFMNSDIRLVKLMLAWLHSIGKIPSDRVKLRLYTHRIYSHLHHESYWSKELGIPLSQFKKTVYKATPHTSAKNPDYKGCMRLEVSGSELFWKIIAWEQMVYTQFTK